MAKNNDITSAEKLLERIRREQSGQNAPSVAQNIPSVKLTIESSEPLPKTLESEPVFEEQPVTPSAIEIPAVARPESIFPAGKTKKFSPRIRFIPLSSKATASIGVELMKDGICLVLLGSTDNSTKHPVGCFIPYETSYPDDEENLLPSLLSSDWFAPFLQKNLQHICGKTKYVSAWCGLPRESVEVHNVVIPKVPENEIADTVFWTLQKQNPFERDEIILDYDLVKEFEDDGTSKILTIVYLAKRKQIDDLKALFNKTGFPLTGICDLTAGLQNQIHKGVFTSGEESFSRLVLGEDKSYIELYLRDTLVFSRDIKTGTSSFVDSVMEQTSLLGVIMDPEQCTDLLMADDAKAEDIATNCGLYVDGKINIFTLELPAGIRLIRQMERTFDYFKNNFQIPRCTAVYLAGCSFGNTRFPAYIAAEIGIPCFVHTPFTAFSTPENIETDCKLFSASRLAPAFGIALSERDFTQNFLFPREIKEKNRLESRINRMAVLVASCLLLLCAGMFFWQHKQIEGKQAHLNAIATEIRQGDFSDLGQADAILTAELGRLEIDSRKLTSLSERYLPLVLVGRVCSTLPSEIKLLRLSMNESSVSSSANGTPGILQNVSMQGIVTGSRNNMEFTLAKYIRRLKENSFVISAVIKEKGTDMHLSKEVLTFTIEVQAAVVEPIIHEKPNA